jgi:hypothetical protein
MVKRVIIGTRGSEKGMWITTPGKDALTSNTQEDFLVNTSKVNTQPVFKGIITNPVVYYQGTTRYTTFDPVVVCEEYDGYWQSCVCYYFEDGQLKAKTYDNCTWVVYCKRSRTDVTQTDHPGVATYQASIPHNLGYLPQSILSATTEYPGNPCPNIFIDEYNIYLRYYENDVGFVGSGIVYTASKPSSYTMYCNIYYTLFAQAA